MADINEDVNQTYDAKVMAEEIASGDEKAPKVNVDADYEASKQFSQSEMDKAGQGAEAAEAAVAPKFEIPEPTDFSAEVKPTGDPADYLAMAREVNPQIAE